MTFYAKPTNRPLALEGWFEKPTNRLFGHVRVKEAYFEYFESCNFSRENTNIDVSVFMVYIRMINISS